MQLIGKVSKWGNSLGLRINQKMADNLQLNAGSEVSLTLDEAKRELIVSPVQNKDVWPMKESEILTGMNHENSHGELLASLLEGETN